MRLARHIIAALLLGASSLSAQRYVGPLHYPANPVPQAPGNVSLRIYGTPGTATCTYYVSAVFPQGETSATGPVSTTQCPNTLNASNYVSVIWQAQPGAIVYRVLKTNSAPATGTIQLGQTTSSFLSDTGQALTAWTKPNSYPPSDVGWAVKNGLFNLPLADTGGQLENVLSWGADKNGILDSSFAMQAAYNALPLTGGIIYFPPGTYLLSSTYVFTKPVILEGAGNSSLIKFTSTTGTVFSWQQGTDPTAGFGSGARDLKFIGPGHSTATTLFHVGGSTPQTGAVGNYFLNVTVSQNQDNTTGFGTCLTTDPSGWGFATTIVNPDFQYCDTGINFYGEKNVVWGGILASNVNSLIINPAADAHLNGVSMDSDTGPYIVNHAGTVTVTGSHFETNLAARSANGFIENGGFMTITGGIMLDDTGNTGTPPFITDVYNAGNGDAFYQSLFWVGTHCQGDITGNFLVTSTAASTGGGMRGYINVDANTGGTLGIFDWSKYEQLFVFNQALGPQTAYAYETDGITKTVSGAAPTGACVSGSEWTNKAGISGTTFYVCVASAWVDVK